MATEPTVGDVIGKLLNVAPLECADCGAVIEPGQAITLQGLTLCPEDGAHRATEMLSERGTKHVSYGDIERAASALELASRLLRAKRLAAFAGRRP